jgi:hypothetical protein
MMLSPRLLPLIAVLCVATACSGGDDEEAVTPGAAVRQPRAAATVDAQATDSSAAASADSTQLQREVFSYRGAGRDPFLSLLKSADVRPLVTDLRVAGITFDATYPARSVAVLRDTAQGKRYSIRRGDELGRMKVMEIRDNAVVVTLDEFGVERQVVLPLRRGKLEETP